MARYQYALASLTQGLQYLFNLGIPAPKQAYQKYAKTYILGDGTTRGAGLPKVEWYWGFIEKEARDALKVFCPNGSAEVYVRTLNDELEWHTYRAVMIWPVGPPDIANDASLKFALTFRILEQID